MKSFINSYIAIGLGTVVGFSICVGLQKHLNANVIKRCNSTINTVAYAKSGVMDIAHCVSRAQYYGPATPIKD